MITNGNHTNTLTKLADKNSHTHPYTHSHTHTHSLNYSMAYWLLMRCSRSCRCLSCHCHCHCNCSCCSLLHLLLATFSTLSWLNKFLLAAVEEQWSRGWGEEHQAPPRVLRLIENRKIRYEINFFARRAPLLELSTENLTQLLAKGCHDSVLGYLTCLSREGVGGKSIVC